MYYRHRNGSYEEVPNDGTVVYYLDRGVDVANMVPFPPGFRMLSGDSAARAYDSKTITYSNKQYAGEPVSNRQSFACLDSSGIDICRSGHSLCAMSTRQDHGVAGDDECLRVGMLHAPPSRSSKDTDLSRMRTWPLWRQ